MSDLPGITNSPSIISCLKDLQVPKEKEQASRYNKIITDFINKKKVPFWYKELSERQMTSAYELLNNLRDDTQQDTTHRTKLNLQLMGLCPIPTTPQIKIAMQWSQGNDLAFLWFILELYYANLDQLLDAEDSTYDSNQQILMSTIVHLDMIPTLRELDRILPKPKKKVEIYKKSARIKSDLKKLKIRQSPYLQILPPWPAEEKVIKARKGGPKEPKPCFAPYDLYTDSNYICPNELNRWYADPEQVCSILDNCSLSDERYNTGEDIINSVNYEMGMGDRMGTQYSEIEEFRKSLTFKLRLAVKKRCEKFLKDNDRSEQQRNIFLHELEGDIKEIEEQFDKLSERFQTQKWLPQFINELLTKTIDMKDVSLCNQILSFAMDNELFGDVIKNINKQKSEVCERIMFDYGHNGKLKDNERYFQRPNAIRPYIFDYARIFSYRTPSLKDSPKINCIKNAVEQALELRKYDTEDDAVLGCLEEMWQYEAKNLNKQIEKRKIKINDFNDDDNQTEDPIPLSLKKKIDPKNDEQMRKLLTSAISEMKKNPKFVMVQLPEVHNLEILKLWIKARYGYRISQQQRDNALRQSKAVYDEIKRLKIKIPIPSNNDITKKSHFNYKNKKQLVDKAQHLIHTYFSELKAEVLKRTQIYWHCMEPTHLKKGPPRQVFFSYLPAKPQDILPFKPWENDDFMDARSAHEKRLASK